MPHVAKATKPNKPAPTVPSTPGPLDTPPNSPTLSPTFTVKLAKDVIETAKLILASQSTSGSNDINPYAGPQAEQNIQPGNPRVQASKLELMTVDEMYVLRRLASVAILITVRSRRLPLRRLTL
jgi:hypothetical protein